MLLASCGVFVFVKGCVAGMGAGSCVNVPGGAVGASGVGSWACSSVVICDVCSGCYVMTGAGGVEGGRGIWLGYEWWLRRVGEKVD